jgi:iron(II)-dependent oxidoreductase
LGSVPAAQATATVTAAEGGVQWVPVAGGRLAETDWRRETDVADLLWSVTPVTGCGRRPVTGLTLDEAARMAGRMGARLPTSAEWEWMAGAGERTYPWGDAEPTADRANLRGLGPGTTTPVGSYRAGATPDGVADVAGNVWEWTTAPWRRDRVALLRGGSYNSLTLYARCGYANDVPPDLVSPGIGFRVVRSA